ncbi:MBL fold metallo-hydrolase [Carboxydothermus ferrireducens]|uniref:Glyoxylase-like metal-dependent hydrolase (Beta-lactamase superfamily II) n=1 Tax=Carboxydothermus ferrireducens DSM 11255 TaxID=1119529 RepID=A0ABX2R5M8_9THEO|nr:MBL fold metallo-hydrolase [Carboxydothermus ferrireducens]NYE56477.1 glyoxylase-like metal-dependent hydrolase (beta-lactamase superfamily II) [Carboxydothermus ferrireducens DSM 11255]
MLKTKVFQEILAIKMGRTIFGKLLYPVHAFYFDGVLIDTGCWHCRFEFSSFLKELNIDKVILTHAHEDHFGNVWAAEKWQIPVYVDEKGLPFLREPRRLKMELYRKITWGEPAKAKALPLPQLVETQHFTLEVIKTPGHSPDHVCFYEPENGYLFSGDLYLGERQNLLMDTENFWEIRNSLKKVLALNPKILFCGLNGYVPGASEKLRAKLNYWDDLADRVLDLADKGLSLREIDQVMFKKKHVISIVSGGSFSSLNLVRSIIRDRKDGEEI